MKKPTRSSNSGSDYLVRPSGSREASPHGADPAGPGVAVLTDLGESERTQERVEILTDIYRAEERLGAGEGVEPRGGHGAGS